MTKINQFIQLKLINIKEYYAKDDDELLDLITSEPDEEYNGGEWVIPKEGKVRK